MAKTVLITGSSRGIGLALVKECVSLGHKVIATCRNPVGAKELNDLLAQSNQPEAVRLDVDDPASIEGAFQKVKTLSPGLDILINNAGIMGAPPGRARRTTSDEMMSVYKTNVVGPLLVNQQCLPLLNKKGADHPIIVNMSAAIASISQNGIGGLTAYRCAKAAVNMMNVNLAREVRDVIWIAMHPGWVDTDMGRGAGGKPPMQPQASAASIMKTLAKMTKDNSGAFIQYDGKPIPF